MLALLPVLVVSARTTLEGAAKSAIFLYCRRHFSSPGIFTLLVSLTLVVSEMCCFSGWLSAAAVPSHSSISQVGGPIGVFSVAPRSLPLIGRLTSYCSTECHFTVPHEAVISGLAPESTCYACKVRSVYFADEARKLLHHLGTVLASCLSATVLGMSKKPLGCGACAMIGIGNWALRTVCKWSKSFKCGGAFGRRSSGFWCRVHLEFAYVAGCRSFGEASRLSRMAVVCRNVYGSRSCAGISQRLSHPQQSL